MRGCKSWQRPTFPPVAVSSALKGLTSLFGMGRGGPLCNSHHKIFNIFKTYIRKKIQKKVESIQIV